MSVPDRVRALPGLVLGLALVAACAAPAPTPSLLPRAVPGQPPGTTVVAGADFDGAVAALRDAAGEGGPPATVVDHRADAAAVGVELPPTTAVIGGPDAAAAPLLRVDQRAAANLPQTYLVRQGDDGAVTVTTNGAGYLAAVSGVPDAPARGELADATAAALRAVAPGVAAPPATPLIGITPAERFVVVAGSTGVAATVERLRRAADREPGRAAAVLDLSAAGAGAGTGPPLRATSVVLVSNPEAEAPLIAATPSAALDLPMRFAVWLDEADITQIGYVDPVALAARHGIAPDDPAVVRLAADADRLARRAAGLAP